MYFCTESGIMLYNTMQYNFSNVYDYILSMTRYWPTFYSVSVYNNPILPRSPSFLIWLDKVAFSGIKNACVSLQLSCKTSFKIILI